MTPQLQYFHLQKQPFFGYCKCHPKGRCVKKEGSNLSKERMKAQQLTGVRAIIAEEHTYLELTKGKHIARPKGYLLDHKSNSRLGQVTDADNY